MINKFKMTSCEIVLNMGLTKTQMKNCVESYIGSKRYLKSVVPMFMCNIIYNRIHGYDDYFESRNINTLKYMIFKPKLKNHQFANIYHWIKSAMEAFDKSYLKDLYLFAKDNVNDTILESFKFTFKYQTEKTEKFPTSKQVIAKTQEILDNINMLNRYEKLPHDVKFEIEITYEAGTPSDYAVPGFEKRDPGTSNVDALSKHQYTNLVKMGNIFTGYHKMKCVAKGKIFEITDIGSEFDTFIEMDDDKGEEDHLSKMQNVQASQILSPSMTSSERSKLEGDAISCPCNLSLVHNNNLFQTVVCNECYSHQHIFCLGYINITEAGYDYLCTKCNKNSKRNEKFISFKDASPEKQRIVALLRLCAMYSNLTDKVPYTIVNKLSSDMQEIIWKELSIKLNIIGMKNGRDAINEDVLEAYIASNFYQPNKTKRKNEEYPSEILHSESSIIKRLKKREIK